MTPPLPSIWQAALRGLPFRLLLAATLALGILPQLFLPALPDVTWLLHMAERLREGARLYVDVIEVNPPLIVWLNLPVVAAADALGVSSLAGYRGMVAGLVLGSFGLCALVVGTLGPALDLDARRLLLLLAAVALSPLAGADFGEREHLLLLLALPYVLLAAARLERVPVPGSVAWPVGLAAGLGLALKPYFLLLPLVLEAGLLLGRRTRPLRPETAAIGLVLLGYLAAIQAWVPEYWSVARTLGGPYYRFLQEPVLLTAVTGHGAGLVLCALLAYGALRERETGRPLLAALFLATLALYGSAIAQRKGWRYHFYPAMGTGYLLLGLLAWQARGVGNLAGRVYRAVAVGIALFLPVSLLGAALARLLAPAAAPAVGDPDLPRLAELVRREAPGQGLLVLSTNMASSFPLVPVSGARWTSRYPSVWLLGAAYQEQLGSDAPLQYREPGERLPIERELMDAVAGDLAREQPALLLVLRPAPDRPEWGIRRLDYLRYFSADPAFARELSRYGFLADVGEYRVYRRLAVAETPAPAPPPVSAGPPAPIAALTPGLQVGLPGPGKLAQAVLFLGLVAVVFLRQSPGQGPEPKEPSA